MRLQTNSEMWQPEEASYDTDIIAALIQQWMSAFNSHNVENIVALYAEDAELFDSGMRRARKGRDEIRGWFTQRFQQMPTIQYKPTRFFFHNQDAAISWVAQGRTPAFLHQRWLSHPFEVDGVSIFRVHAGRIAWQHGYYDHLHIAERVIPPLRWLPLKL